MEVPTVHRKLSADRGLGRIVRATTPKPQVATTLVLQPVVKHRSSTSILVATFHCHSLPPSPPGLTILKAPHKHVYPYVNVTANMNELIGWKTTIVEIIAILVEMIE